MKLKSNTPINIILVILCLSLGTSLSAQSKKYEALLGTWDVETDSAQYTFVFEFVMEGDTLKGKFTGSSGETDMQKLSFEDNNLEFSVEVSDGMVIDFLATIDGGLLEGSLALEYGEANIAGEKRKE